MNYDNIWFYEWDFFSKPYVVSDLSIQLGPIIIEKMTFKRNDDYSISIECVSQVEDTNPFFNYCKQLQEPISFSFEIPHIGERCKIENGYISNHQSHGKTDSKIKFLEFEISHCSVLISGKQTLKKISSSIEYYINGSEPKFVFHRRTDRKLSEKYEKNVTIPFLTNYQ